ncbi:hypothetical protein [Paenibacillus sp. NRS-1760]|uniref:hypothetical protein n=1 Tax=Paenibacillus sp. NRS-1760 TaxID=3233902 RepID=UPI003D2D447B
MDITEEDIKKLLQDAINKLSKLFDQISIEFEETEEDIIQISDFDSLLHDIDELIYFSQNNRESNWSIIIKLRDTLNKEVQGDTEEKLLTCRKLTAEFLLNLYFIIAGIDDEEKHINSLVNMWNIITEVTHKQYSEKQDLYYKNTLIVEQHRKFEEMTDLLQTELIAFDINLFYCEKLIHFIDNELSQNQLVFHMNLHFIQQFINNSFFVMILTSTKLFSTAKQDKNFGFDFLKNFINQSCKRSDEQIVQSLRKVSGGEVRGLINDGKVLCKEIENIRNYYLAHYDIMKIEQIRKIQLDLKLFNEIYNVSVKIFEILSLKRFHRLDTAYSNLIKFQGFEKIVCQNYLLRGNGLSDVDIYLNHLRKNHLIPKSE